VKGGSIRLVRVPRSEGNGAALQADGKRVMLWSSHKHEMEKHNMKHYADLERGKSSRTAGSHRKRPFNTLLPELQLRPSRLSGAIIE
jgi:hypothetical protein